MSPADEDVERGSITALGTTRDAAAGDRGHFLALTFTSTMTSTSATVLTAMTRERLPESFLQEVA